MVGLVAVGGPNLVSGEGWDTAPLVLMAVLLILMSLAGTRLRGPILVAAAVTGLALDLLTDVLEISPLLVVTPIVAAVTVVVLRGTTVP